MKRLFTLLLVLVCTAVGTAQTVTYQFSGTITTITRNTNNAMPGVYLGQLFSGQVSYSDMPTNMNGIYNQAGDISFMLGSTRFDFINDNLVFMVNNYKPGDTGSYDLFRIYTYSYLNGYYFSRTGLELLDYTKTALTDNSLRTDMDYSKFNPVTFNIYAGLTQSSGEISMQATIDQLTLVPEPATLVLLGLGAVAVMRRRVNV